MLWVILVPAHPDHFKVDLLIPAKPGVFCIVRYLNVEKVENLSI